MLRIFHSKIASILPGEDLDVFAVRTLIKDDASVFGEGFYFAFQLHRNVTDWTLIGLLQFGFQLSFVIS